VREKFTESICFVWGVMKPNVLSRFKVTAYFVIVYFVGFSFIGCATHVKYLAPYHPADYKVVVVIIPQGPSGATLGKVLDRLENEPFHVVSMTEEQCQMRSDLSSLFEKGHRITPAIACAIAKSVNASLVIFSNRPGFERHGKGGEHGEGEGRPEPPEGGFGGGGPEGGPESGGGGGFGGGHGSHGHRGGGGEGQPHGKMGMDSQFSIMNVPDAQLLWEEKLDANPSESDLQGFAHRLVTDGIPAKLSKPNQPHDNKYR